MPGIEIEGPDGQVHTFPSGTPHALINQQMERVYGGAGGVPAVQPPGGLQKPTDPTPRAGDPTAVGGAMAPGTRTVAPYQSDEDWSNIGLAAVLGEKNRGVIQAIQNTPGHVARIEGAKKAADLNASKGAQQIATQKLLENLDEIDLASNRAGSGVLSKAIGPNYGEPEGKGRGFIGAATHDLSTMWNGIAANRDNRAMMYGLDTGSPSYVAQQARLNSTYDPSKHGQPGEDGKPILPNDYDKALALNTEMHHFKKGIATQFKSIPGSGDKGGTDQAQATLEEMVQAAINAPDPESHFKVLHDARNFIRGMSGLPKVPPQESYIPPGFGPARSAMEAQLKPGSAYIHNGQPWTYKGGPAADPNSWAPQQ